MPALTVKRSLREGEAVGSRQEGFGRQGVRTARTGEVGQRRVAARFQVRQPRRRADEQRTPGELRRVSAPRQVRAQQGRIACPRTRKLTDDGGG